MPYIVESLSEGERVEHLFRLHWTSWIWLGLWIVLALASPAVWWPAAALWLVLAAYEWLRLRCIEMGVTSKRVILKTGIISRKSDEMKLGSIETVEIEQGILGRILGFGTVRVTGRGMSDLVFHGIDDPMDVKRQIESVPP
jgi:membrane protein YdbS with pleckstrin-like domain